MRTGHIGAVLCAVAVAMSIPALAKVPKDQADRLLQPNGDLTPMGAEKAANKAGTIPAWNGGWTQAPPDWKGPGSHLADPFPDDKPQFTITPDTLAKYRANLSPGQLAL